MAFTPPYLYDSRWRGLRIGILGGSFNPPHAGHVHAASAAMKRLGLDAVWWMVSPGNPLKAGAEMLPFETRMELCRRLARDPRFVVSDLERQMGTVRTYDTIHALQRRFPGTEFIMLGGMDIAHQLPRWYRWRALPGMAAMGFIARQPEDSLVRGTAIRAVARRNIHGNSAKPLLAGDCHWLLMGRMDPSSSTAIRNG